MNGERPERVVRLRVGVFVLLALAAFLGLIYALGARARLFERRYTVHADFTEVGGITEGATVRLAGVQIGRVSGVHLPAEPGGKVRVDLTIARQYENRIRQNSVARIETQGLLGDKIVEITVGTVAVAAVPPDGTIPAQDPVNIGQVIGRGAATVQSVAAVAESLRTAAETFSRSHVMDELGQTVESARRVTDQVGRIADRVEKGPGLAHALLYDEPVALRRLNDTLASTQALIDRVNRGEGAAGVLLSPDSTQAARRLVRLMDRIGRLADEPPGEQGLLPSLLFDPRYRGMLDDLRGVAHNFREVSDRLAGGQGMLGHLIKDEPRGDLRETLADLRATVDNLKEITDKLNRGEGTLGLLIADPTIYERLVAILEGTQRSFLLRNLIRGLGRGSGAAGSPGQAQPPPKR